MPFGDRVRIGRDMIRLTALISQLSTHKLNEPSRSGLRLR
jgi:hypothetical protein